MNDSKRQISQAPVIHNLKLKNENNELPYFLFFVLSLCLILGLIAGSFVASTFEMQKDVTFIPMLFSGIPTVEASFFSYFSTFLLNALVSLLFLFLLGMTAFGVLAIPVFLFFKGLSIGVAMISFLYNDSFFISLFLYLLPTALILGISMLFAVRSFYYTKSFCKVFFSSGQIKAPDFTVYLKSFFLFLFFSVLISFLGASINSLYFLFF